VTLVQALRLCTGRTAHRGSRGIAVRYSAGGGMRGVLRVGLGECDNMDGLSDGGRHRHQHLLETSLAEEGEFRGQVEYGKKKKR
jgi:hypothetical protein